MVNGAGTLRESGLRGPNLELAIHGHRIAIHDLAAETFRERQRECGLPTPGRTENHDQQGIGRRDQRAPQAM
jgi:hypothetical protein